MSNTIFSEEFIEVLADKIADRLVEKLGASVGTAAKNNKVTTKLLSVTEVCEILGVSTSTLYRRIKEGDLEAVYVGRHVKFSQESIDRYLKEINCA